MSTIHKETFILFLDTIILDVEDSSGVFSTYGIFQEGTKTFADRNIR